MVDDHPNELDEILAEGNEVETLPEQETEQPEGAKRDANGRFAAKEPENQEQPEAEAATETPTEDEQPEADQQGGMVPQKALHEERQRVKEMRDEMAELRRQNQQITAQLQAFMSQQQPKPAEQEKKAPDFWENPSEFVNHAVSPLEQKIQKRFEAISLRSAVGEHGQETVQAAYQAMGEAMQSGDPSAQAEYQRIMQSDHPYGDLVSWHQRRQALSEIGNDPAAYRAKLEAEIRQKLEAEMGQGQRQQTSTKPLTKLPQSLSRIPGGSAAGSNDVSDAALFSHAMQ
ncbi:hypothetical protein NO932_06590 [Pelagibacterium sp. 26DY04]|uniref:hypothetical protein n=1 Tax=Pelagibacterium sp. 26DY04 TaxID=2967130 RepID=UPI002814A0EC|nr:hypothetical protein [Pelagibacterium sp. 26DY04]WMT88273.1 hypothetical protein NO932_06590 [Pelagibacterium sp. 26DY04]